MQVTEEAKKFEKEVVDDQVRVLMDKAALKQVSKHALGKWDAAAGEWA